MSFVRVRALVVIGVLVTCAAILVAVTLVKDRQRHAVDADACPKDAVIADLDMPEPKNVKINFVDASGNTAMASDTAEEFKYREFQVTVGPKEATISQVAVLRYGPKGVGSAWLLRAYFLDSATTQFDIKRTDTTVDVVLGAKFKKLATASEVGQALSDIGRPQRPDGTCAKEEVS